MINPHDPLVELKITSATCSFFAMGTTMYRLYKRRGRYWADDIWALFALVALVIQVIAVFLHLPVPNNLSRTTRVAAYYLMAFTFYAVIWASRLSILLSIVRLDPSKESHKRLFWVAVAFVVAALFLFAQLLWVCEPEPSWMNDANPQCRLPLQVAICQLVTDVIADSILLIAPIPLFQSLADNALRRKLTIIFSTCVVTTVVSLVHAVFILRHGGPKVLIAALVEDCLSLIVANIPIVITSVVKLSREDAVYTAQTTSLRFNNEPWFSGGLSTGRGVTTRGTGLVAPVGLELAAGTSTYVEEAPDVAVSKKRWTSITWDTGDRSPWTAVETVGHTQSQTEV